MREKNEALDHLTTMLRKEQERANELEEQVNQQAFAETYFERMRELLREHSPELESVVDIALKQERLQNEKKNQKVPSPIWRIILSNTGIDSADVHR